MRRIMKRRDNFKAIDEMRKMLSETKRLTLENYINSEENPYGEEDYYGGDEYGDEEILSNKESQMSGISDIEKELIQIRKIALSVINRLADQTSSESYDTMKRIWSLVDKAIESKNQEMGNDNKKG